MSRKKKSAAADLGGMLIRGALWLGVGFTAVKIGQAIRGGTK